MKHYISRECANAIERLTFVRRTRGINICDMLNAYVSDYLPLKPASMSLLQKPVTVKYLEACRGCMRNQSCVFMKEGRAYMLYSVREEVYL
jgi:hypothetical protein